ncbi:hypothetical protein JOM56_009003 [Amanita muscaria]
MAHTVYWQNKSFLYAVGNTPAVSFANDLPPEQPGEFLLLGCGDARSILYTVYADIGARRARKLDFTCCDIEPGILARNVLLYSLLSELLDDDDSNVTIQKIWNFYYHIFIDDGTLSMLVTQCQRLVDLSADINTWNNSKYGTFLRVCSQHTLSVLHRFWLQYAKMKNLTRAEKDSLRDQVRSSNKGVHSRGVNLTTLHAAGPFWNELKELGALHFKHYWTTGVTFTDSDKIAAASQINPTFAYSSAGRGITLHYGCDPLLSFHLANGLAPLEGQSSKTLSISTLVNCAMSEFESWCYAFSKRLADALASLVIRFFAGDALGFCRSLHYCSASHSIQTPIYVGPWTTQLIALDGGDYLMDSPLSAPTQFNVIDSSNLRDYLGLMNVLIITIPLLERKPYSTIYTDALHPAKEENVARRGLLDELCGDVTTMSLLLDLCPVSFVSNFTTHSNVHEIISVALASSGKQFHEHVSWKICSLANTEIAEMDDVSDRRLRFDQRQLAHFLYGVYLEMFWEERNAMQYRDVLGIKEITRRLTLPHYVRATLVALLNLIKSRVDTDWDAMVTLLYDLITNDRVLITGDSNFQDLFLALHVSRVQTLVTFLPGFSDKFANEDDPIAKKGWLDVPPIVCITFKVPRRKLKHIENYTAEQLGNPILLCNIMSATVHNFFQNYLAFFGDVKVESSGPNDRDLSITYEEDPQGIRGSSPVIFSFYIPTWIIRKNGSKINVALSLRSTPAVTQQLRQILDPSLVLFSKPLVDDKYVFITPERPGNPGELEKLQSWVPMKPVLPNSSPRADAVKVTLDVSTRKTILLTRRANIVDKDAQATLADKAPVEINQVSPQAMEATFGLQKQIIPFPYPIDPTDVKTRIARKSFYLEVDVKPSGPLKKCGMSVNQFPIVKSGNSLAVWNIHYLDLDRLPVLNTSMKDKLAFLHPHLLLANSDREIKESRALDRQQLREEDLDPVLCLKHSINNMFKQSCGLQRGRGIQRVYALSDPGYKEQYNGMYCIIFVNNIRLDLASHTLVLDAYVIPKVSNEIEALFESLGQLVKVNTQAKETKAWKYLLPAFVERCRTWSHTENCEYHSEGVPVSVETMESPLCSCGTGKNSGSFEPKWKDFAPYVTRAAISPLFAVPFVDTVGGNLLEYMSEHYAPKDVVKTACAKCGGPGRPKLLFCGKCGRVTYCSPECQKAHWKSHRAQCRK